MESSRSSTQTITTTSSNVVETFVKARFIEASKMRIYLQVQKDIINSFLRIVKNPFPMLLSTVQMESSLSSTQTIMTNFSNVVKNFFKHLLLKPQK